jgi:hypothetical protein
MPAWKRQQTKALDRTATKIGKSFKIQRLFEKHDGVY